MGKKNKINYLIHSIRHSTPLPIYFLMSFTLTEPTTLVITQILQESKSTHLLNCFLSEWEPVPHSHVDIYRHVLWFQSHSECICLYHVAKAKKFKNRIELENQQTLYTNRFIIVKQNRLCKQNLKEGFQQDFCCIFYTCSSVILRNGEPPPIEAYPSLLLGALSTEINFANGFWRNRNSLGRRIISCHTAFVFHHQEKYTNKSNRHRFMQGRKSRPTYWVSK